MREPIAGTWLFGIVALFIVLFSGFMAYAISYTKAFKVKNEIINMIERKEGFTESLEDIQNMSVDDLMESDKTDAQVLAMLKKMGYNSADIACKPEQGRLKIGGFCLRRSCVDVDSKGVPNKVYYKVTSFVKVNIPLINVMLKIPVSGETKVLYYEDKHVNKTQCD